MPSKSSASVPVMITLFPKRNTHLSTCVISRTWDREQSWSLQWLALETTCLTPHIDSSRNVDFCTFTLQSSQLQTVRVLEKCFKWQQSYLRPTIPSLRSSSSSTWERSKKRTSQKSQWRRWKKRRRKKVRLKQKLWLRLSQLRRSFL